MKTPRNWFDLMPLTVFDNATCGQRKIIEQWIGRIQQDAIKSFESKPSKKNENKEIENKVKKLVGKDVYIKWCNPKYDWPTFYVIEYNKTNARVLLRGIDDLDGNRHDGCKFGVYVTEIESIREIGSK